MQISTVHYICSISLFCTWIHPGEASSMNTNHMWRFQGPDKLTGLLVIRVSRERNVIHRHLQRQFLPWHSCDLFRFRHDMLGKKKSFFNKKNWKSSIDIVNPGLYISNTNEILLTARCNAKNGKSSSNFTKCMHPNRKTARTTHMANWYRSVLLPDASQCSLHWNYNECVTSSPKSQTRHFSCPQLLELKKNFILYNETVAQHAKCTLISDIYVVLDLTPTSLTLGLGPLVDPGV